MDRWRAGARSELRRQLREAQRMRQITLVAVVLLVLGAYPLYLATQVASRDPVFNALDTLDVPDWADGAPTDVVFGSRWCIKECRFRERTLESQRSPDETAQAYEKALRDGGWQPWAVEGCPTDLPGHYTCWTRDEYTLDLYVRDPACADDPLRRRPTVAPNRTPTQQASPVEVCEGAAVTLKVRNRIDDERGRGDPGQVVPTDTEPGGAGPGGPSPGASRAGTPRPSGSPG